jgi:hypothetical protein
MPSKERISVLSGFLLFAISLDMTGCVRPPEQPRVEQAPQPEATQSPALSTAEAKPAVTLDLQPPTSADVRSAIARIYKDTVIVDARRFVVGDFNGDGYQDVAAVVKPVMAMLPEINSRVANWILEEPQRVVLPDAKKATQPLAPVPPPTRVVESDILVAVLHGHGPAGWRSPESRQTYLLKNAVGSDMKSLPIKSLLKDGHATEPLPKLLGDVISEKIGAEFGFLYYSGAKYVWYPRARTATSVASR